MSAKSFTFEVAKVNKRLWIRGVEHGELVYTPPNWIRDRLNSREPMVELADRFTEKLGYDIRAVIDFEVRYGKVVRCPPPREVD